MIGGGVEMKQDEVSAARSRKLKSVGLVNPIVGEIADALLGFGGQAHRAAVINLVAQRRGGEIASEGLTRELIEAFEVHCQQAIKQDRPAMLHLPFGEGSHRWALTLDARVALHRSSRSWAG